MTLEEAKSRMRELEEEQLRFHDEVSKDGYICSSDTERECYHKLMDNHNARRSLGNQLASYQHIREHMWCWMIDIIGTESNTEDSLIECIGVLEENGVSPESASRFGGALAEEVLKFLKDHGITPTDMGGGRSSWHIGAPANQEDMETGTTQLHKKFAAAIKAGLIRIEVKFWGWRFNDLYDRGEQ